MRPYRLLFFPLLAAVVLHGRSAKAQDDEDSDRRDSNCTGSFDGGRVNGTLNVVGRCQLRQTDVRGDVILFAGGSLIARGARIRGTLDGSRADFVDLDDVRVDGNVNLRELVGDSSSIESSDIRGDLVLTGNRSRFEIVDNELRRDLTALGNTGGLRIAGNTINGDLDCSGNVPAPTLLGNRIEGDAEGQCATSPPPPAADAPRDDQPPTPRLPAASPPSTPAPPATPAASPPPATLAATTASPATAPPAATPPPAAAAPQAATDTALVDDGGAGAIGWPMIALLVPFLAWRRRRQPR